jgi:hypothetical protein
MRDYNDASDTPVVALAIVGAVGAILLWLFLSAPASPVRAFSALGAGEVGAFTSPA